MPHGQPVGDEVIPRHAHVLRPSQRAEDEKTDGSGAHHHFIDSLEGFFFDPSADVGDAAGLAGWAGACATGAGVLLSSSMMRCASSRRDIVALLTVRESPSGMTFVNV